MAYTRIYRFPKRSRFLEFRIEANFLPRNRKNKNTFALLPLYLFISEMKDASRKKKEKKYTIMKTRNEERKEDVWREIEKGRDKR